MISTWALSPFLEIDRRRTVPCCHTGTTLVRRSKLVQSSSNRVSPTPPLHFFYPPPHAHPLRISPPWSRRMHPIGRRVLAGCRRACCGEARPGGAGAAGGDGIPCRRVRREGKAGTRQAGRQGCWLSCVCGGCVCGGNPGVCKAGQSVKSRSTGSFDRVPSFAAWYQTNKRMHGVDHARRRVFAEQQAAAPSLRADSRAGWCRCRRCAGPSCRRRFCVVAPPRPGVPISASLHSAAAVSASDSVFAFSTPLFGSAPLLAVPFFPSWRCFPPSRLFLFFCSFSSLLGPARSDAIGRERAVGKQGAKAVRAQPDPARLLPRDRRQPRRPAGVGCWFIAKLGWVAPLSCAVPVSSGGRKGGALVRRAAQVSSKLSTLFRGRGGRMGEQDTARLRAVSTQKQLPGSGTKQGRAWKEHGKTENHRLRHWKPTFSSRKGCSFLAMRVARRGAAAALSQRSSAV